MSPEKTQPPEPVESGSEFARLYVRSLRDDERTLLHYYLHLSDTHPQLRLPLIIEDDPWATWANRQLLLIGAFRPAPEITLLDCPECGKVSVRPLPAPHPVGWDYYCGPCGKIVDLPQQQRILALSMDWWFGALAKAFKATGHRHAYVSLPGYLWEVGEFALSNGTTVNLLFARVDGMVSEAKIFDRLLELPPHGQYIVLCSRQAPLIQTFAKERKNLVVNLGEIGEIDQTGLQLDTGPLIDALEPSAQAPRIEIAPDGSWLRVKGKEIRLRGKQRNLALVMVEAYQQGITRPKAEWVLRRAGYGPAMTKLRDLTKRKDFFEVFDYGDGEVWLRL